MIRKNIYGISSAMLLGMSTCYAAADASDYTGDIFIIREVQTDKIFWRCSAPNNCTEAPIAAGIDERIRILSDDGSGKLIVVSNEPKNFAKATSYSVKKTELNLTTNEHDGWTTGVLSTPFKYFTGSKNVTSSVSIGKYLGYTWEATYKNFAVTPLASVGITSINAQSIQPNATSTTSSNLTGIGWAVGCIVTMNKRNGFQFGLLAGKDYVGANSTVTYKYEGNFWYGLAIGYQFAQ